MTPKSKKGRDDPPFRSGKSDRQADNSKSPTLYYFHVRFMSLTVTR
jgi:hypothetical protein